MYEYRPATDDDEGVCLNLLPLPNGMMQPTEPRINAVIIQIAMNDDMETTRHIVSIECKDEYMYSHLRHQARKLLECLK